MRAKDRSQARARADGTRARTDDLRSMGAARAVGGRGAAGTEGEMGAPGADGVLRAVWAATGGAGTERGGTGVTVLRRATACGASEARSPWEGPAGRACGAWVVADSVGVERGGLAAMTDGARGDRVRPVDVWAVAGGTVAVTGDAGDVGAVVMGARDVTHAGATGEACEAGATTALGRRGGRHVGRPGGSVPGGGGARAGGRRDQTGQGGKGGDKRGSARAGEDATGGAVLRITGDVTGRVVEARGPRGLLPVDDGARGVSGEGGMTGDAAGTVTGDRSDVGGGAEATKRGEAGCCAMGAETGRIDGGMGATGGAMDNSGVDEASEARDRG